MDIGPADEGVTAGLDPLQALFQPGSVAVVGASADERKYGNWLSRQALRSEHRRPVHLVSRRGEKVLGRATSQSLSAVGQAIDLAVIAVPAVSFESVVDDAIAVGCRALVGITAGFAELGSTGAAREAAVVRRVKNAGAVLLGPNSLGVLDSSAELYLTSNAMPCGDVGFLSQSGNLALELSLFLEQHGRGFSRFASLGNQAQLSAADLVDSLVADPATKAIGVYCEDFRDGRAFVAAAARAVEAGKAVVLLTVGVSVASQRGARSHTGAMTSDSSVVDAACRAAGVVRVHSPRELADALIMCGEGLRTPARRLAVIADGGGHASVASDIAATQGLEVAPFPTALQDLLRGQLPPSAGVSNPVDLAGAGEQDITSFHRILGQVLDDQDTDAVLLTGYFGGYGSYGPELARTEMQTARDMVSRAKHSGKPVVLHTMLPDTEAADHLRRSGIPVFRAVEDAAHALALLDRLGSRSLTRPLPLPPPDPPLRGDSYWDSRQLLSEAGIPFPLATLVVTPAEACEAAAVIGFPVAVKAMGLLHKSDVGGVSLSLTTADEVLAACDEMDRLLNPPGFSVEAMADLSNSLELIAGVQQDARFGPVLMLGLGGVFTEVLHDVVFELAPVAPERAVDALMRLRSAPLLSGARGRPKLDVEATGRALAALSRVAAAHPEIAEIEVNPLLVSAAGCLALDSRIVLRDSDLRHDTDNTQEM